MATSQTLIVGREGFYLLRGDHLVPCIEPQCGLPSCKILFLGRDGILFFAMKSRDDVFGYVK